MSVFHLCQFRVWSSITRLLNKTLKMSTWTTVPEQIVHILMEKTRKTRWQKCVCTYCTFLLHTYAKFWTDICPKKSISPNKSSFDLFTVCCVRPGHIKTLVTWFKSYLYLSPLKITSHLPLRKSRVLVSCIDVFWLTGLDLCSLEVAHTSS